MRRFGLLIACGALSLLPFRTVHSSPGVPDQTLAWVTVEAKVPRVVFRTFDSKTTGGKVSITPTFRRPTAGRKLACQCFTGCTGQTEGLMAFV